MVKDEIVSWFIRNLLLPKMEMIDMPGFIITTSGNIHLREIRIPESLITRLENMISQEYGDRGEHSLYSSGKKFGYAYSSLADFPRCDNCSREKLEEFIYFLIRWVGTTYSRDIRHSAMSPLQN